MVMVTRTIGDTFIEITGLMATFWACNTVMKYLCQNHSGSFLYELITVILCYVIVPFITFISIIHPKYAKIWRRLSTLRNSKILLFTIIEVRELISLNNFKIDF